MRNGRSRRLQMVYETSGRRLAVAGTLEAAMFRLRSRARDWIGPTTTITCFAAAMITMEVTSRPLLLTYSELDWFDAAQARLWNATLTWYGFVGIFLGLALVTKQVWFPVGGRLFWTIPFFGIALSGTIVAIGRLFRDNLQLDVVVSLAQLVLLVLAACGGAMSIHFLRRVYRRQALGFCLNCGYDLRGNVSGRCPECGVSVPIDDRSRTELDSVGRSRGT